MAFIFFCTSSDKSFIISLTDGIELENQFAKGYSKSRLESFASSLDEDHQSFFAGKPASHALIINVARNSLFFLKIEDLDVVVEAIEELERCGLTKNPVYGLLQNSKVIIETNGVSYYQIDVICEYTQARRDARRNARRNGS